MLLCKKCKGFGFVNDEICDECDGEGIEETKTIINKKNNRKKFAEENIDDNNYIKKLKFDKKNATRNWEY